MTNRRLVREIQTRAYELDRHGRVPTAVLLRYLEHCRWEAARDRQLGLAQMFGRSGWMVVRAQRLELVRPLRRDEVLRISVWLEAAGRTSLTMAHGLTVAESDEPVGTALLVGVRVDGAGRPTPMPEDIQALLSPQGLATGRSAPLGEAPADAFRASVVVRPSDTDMLGHANHARYAEWVEDARELAAEAGALGRAARSHPATSSLGIDYHQECLTGDALELVVWREAEGTVAVRAQRLSDGAAVFGARVGLGGGEAD